MSKLYMTKGLPASGKSTWAEEHQEKNPSTKIICKDNLRDMLDSGKWSGGREKFIVRTRNLLVEQALDEGYDVIVADTNLHPKHEETLKGIAGEYDAEFIIKDFTDVTVEECITRDEARERTVGSKVIRNMYNQFLAEPKEEPEMDVTKEDCILVDVDGTLAFCEGIRSPYDGTRVHLDRPNTRLIEVVNTLSHDYKIIILTAREQKFGEATVQWLKDNNVLFNDIYMRETGDYRKDAVIKKEILDEVILPNYNVFMVFDDRPQVIRMWKEQGLLVADVGPGYEF